MGLLRQDRSRLIAQSNRWAIGLGFQSSGEVMGRAGGSVMSLIDLYSQLYTLQSNLDKTI